MSQSACQMDIERKKVESIGGFATKTKATLAALLGISGALTISAATTDSTNWKLLTMNIPMKFLFRML